MTRHESVAGLRLCAGRLFLWWLGGLAAVLLVLAGCGQTSQQRGKAADEPEISRYDIPTVGDRTAIGNAEPVPLGGVGLVEGLEGTGGDCPHDSYRAMLVEDLQKSGERNVNQLISSPDCALVIVEAFAPPGSTRGDRIEVTVKLPPGSRATSLRGGVLRKCYLYNFDFARNLRPDYNGPQGLLKGHKIAEARGPVLVGGEGEEAEKQGRIWQGGQCLAELPLALVMAPDSQQARYTSLISDRINSTFPHAGVRGSLDSRLAHTADNISVSLRVPPQYRHNLPRYLRVVRMIPLSESVDLAPKEGEDRRSYRQKLAADLLDPARTIVAAIRLEALGTKSLPALKEGLKSPHPLVRFASAEALAYLGSPSGCEELGRCAARYPVLRAYCLSALASLDEAASLLQLRQLILSDLDDEARAGAFRALHLLNERDPLVRGELLNESFWLHTVATDARPLIHVSTAKRPEVVLFGPAPALRPPFSLLAGEFAITAAEEGGAVTVSYVPRGGSPVRKVCSPEVAELTRSMAELGATFSEVLAMLQQANTCGAITCPLRIDALPQPASVHELAKLGKDPTGQELLPAGGAAAVRPEPEGGGR